DQSWIVNLNRTRPARGGKPMGEWSWAVMGSNDYHQVSDFGKITGVGIPRRDDGVTRKAAPAPPPPSYNKGRKAGSVVVYHDFGDVDIPDRGKGTAKGYPLNIRGAKGMKVAFLARGTGGVNSAAFNMGDKRSGDNTTSLAYRTVGEQWGPILYFPDRFRYNSNMNTVSANVEYTNIRFHGNQTGGKGVLQLRDLIIYRGEDTTPPPAPQEKHL
ncbi:hypothetical protein LCGC14_0312650, partial [marine sediment metagenome]